MKKPAAEKPRLTGEAAKMWERIKDEIDSDSPFEVESGYQYCELHDVFMRAKNQFATSKEFSFSCGNGAEQPHPAIKTMKDMSAQMRQLRGSFKSGKKRKQTADERFPV